jgi:hypothetical protein
LFSCILLNLNEVVIKHEQNIYLLYVFKIGEKNLVLVDSAHMDG